MLATAADAAHQHVQDLLPRLSLLQLLLRHLINSCWAHTSVKGDRHALAHTQDPKHSQSPHPQVSLLLLL